MSPAGKPAKQQELAAAGSQCLVMNHLVGDSWVAEGGRNTPRGKGASRTGRHGRHCRPKPGAVPPHMRTCEPVTDTELKLISAASPTGSRRG